MLGKEREEEGYRKGTGREEEGKAGDRLYTPLN